MQDSESRGNLLTEQANPNSTELDCLSPLAFVELCNREDEKTIAAVRAVRQELADAIAAIASALVKGGRLFYVGAGTSGRLGVLDAAECPPTFCTPPELVQGIIAGGEAALVRSSEALEDRAEDGAAAVREREVCEVDVVAGISAGGTTPYVRGALQGARQLGATTIFIACVPAADVPAAVDIDIRLLVGPEVLAGSTRLKAGTATKMALNILSTGAMVQLGKTYGNRMVDVAVTNSKLRDRAHRIVGDLTGCDRAAAADLLERSQLRVKLALLMHWSGLDAVAGECLLDEHNGNLRIALAAAGVGSKSGS
ncbi:N-acetylmuramic acid 6-phosphate etherase [Rubidibacter lacunae KORDI 51-2]|uniref:N-acetylmuramic acid 6-phosphate etherase n=1 Tax=Rubidibacter lacunae KORDI 51-2 TaxID=582515 RepID=U5DF18_9CHRO|nr:N-acetylmuramic acid 6-phosphate etherase [Rubidibacter lacunae]ERN40201.1 N-acetylmuramic acid 6-phosphate etherase [Rubidibacter lacunae KORDI 51-2]